MSEKIKNFLRCKITDMKKVIKCLKLKNLAVQCIHGGLITISVAAAALITILVPLGVTVIVLGLVTSTAAVSSSISMKFHFKRKHEKLSNLIKQISILKDQLDYIVECNSELSDEQCRNMLRDFRSFNAK